MGERVLPEVRDGDVVQWTLHHSSAGPAIARHTSPLGDPLDRLFHPVAMDMRTEGQVEMALARGESYTVEAGHDWERDGLTRLVGPGGSRLDRAGQVQEWSGPV